jgi:ABC-type maltose transport system permease subunit
VPCSAHFPLARIPFTTWYANTVLVSVSSTLVSVVVASLGSYTLGRLR